VKNNMKKSIYLINVEKEIKRQIKWSNFKTGIELRKFLVEIIKYCEDLFDESLDRQK